MSTLKKNLFILSLILVIVVFALVINVGSDFEGADGMAEDIIIETNPDYEPWFDVVWEPPSGEIESLLFALQAAIGAGFICFYLGYKIGQKKGIGVV